MYYFLCATLPGLQFGKESSLTVEKFDAACRDQMPPAEFGRLTRQGLSVPRDPRASDELSPGYAGFVRFEQYLRTRIAQRRTAREEEKSAALPDPAEYFSEVDSTVAQAAACTDPLEREKMIDRLRWRRLDDLGAGHEFDFEALCIYRLRLAILDKYRNRSTEAGKRNFNAAVDRISAAAPAPAGEPGVN